MVGGVWWRNIIGDSFFEKYLFASELFSSPFFNFFRIIVILHLNYFKI